LTITGSCQEQEMTPLEPGTASGDAQAAPADRPRIGIDGDDYLLEAGDLSLLADRIGARSNPLALLPAGDLAAVDKDRLDAAYAQLEEAHRQRLAIAIGVLRESLHKSATRAIFE